MSDIEPEVSELSDQDATERMANGQGALEAPPAPAQRPRWKRILKRTLVTIGSLVGIAVVSAVLLYNFGGMGGSADPTMGAQFEQMVASGQAESIGHRFVIPIPGCTCHSTDPVQTAKHRTYRMRECMRCHATRPAIDVPI